jgi:peptide/nickel transport system permease protein
MTVGAVPVEELVEAPAEAGRETARALLRNKKLVLGSVVFLALLLTALIAGTFVEPKERRTGAFPRKQEPTSAAILGTTSLGQSVAVQWTQAVPNSIKVGLIAATIGTVVGGLVGLISGFYGGRVDAGLRILIDVFLAVPSLLFLILIASLLKGISIPAMALIIGIFAWSWPARAVRAQTLSLKERPFVKVARLSGMGNLEIVVRELLPHMFAWLGANFMNAFIVAILAEAGLSLLGLGPQKDMTLGMMIYWAQSYGAVLQNLWWWWITPVVTLIALFLSLYLVHLGLDEIGNPRLRTQG